MSGWQPGDLALCVKLNRWVACRTKHEIFNRKVPRPGGVYTVEASGTIDQSLFLLLRGFPRDSWKAVNFIRVTPPASMLVENNETNIPIPEPA